MENDKLEKIEKFKVRTKSLAIDVIMYYKSMPKSEENVIIGKQLIRSATSVAANYRAACRARSDAEFFSKISIVVEEADETLFWLELINEIGTNQNITKLMQEALEITKIVNTIRHSLKKEK